jgi:hypothetical protein
LIVSPRRSKWYGTYPIVGFDDVGSGMGDCAGDESVPEAISASSEVFAARRLDAVLDRLSMWF